MASCKGILCGAGFETPEEAIFLKKKLMVIPMKKNQYEQHFNATALSPLGVPVLKSLKKKRIPEIENWTESINLVELHFPNETQQPINTNLFDFIANEMMQLSKKNKKTNKYFNINKKSVFLFRLIKKNS